MVIDFHTHIFPEKIAKSTLDLLEANCKDKPATNGMADGLLASMDESGLVCSIILPVVTRPEQFQSINRFASQFRGDKLISFGGIHPDSEDYKGQLRQLKEMGFQGIKLHPDYQKVFIDDIRYKRIISYATELGLIISIHAGLDPVSPQCVHCPPKRACDMFREVQPSHLILAHMGGNRRWDEVEEYLVGLPIWFDTAAVFGKINDGQFLRIVRNHGPERILFATDSPWASQKSFVEYLQRLPLNEGEKQKILYENARQMLALKQ